MRRLSWTAAGALLLGLALGCGSRLHDERTVTVEPGGDHFLSIDPPTRDQKVQVKVETSGGPVNVYCYLEADKKEAERAAALHKASDKILAKAEKTSGADLEFSVPAKSGAVVMLSSAFGKTVSAKVTMDGK